MPTRRELLQQMAWITAGSFMMQNAFAFNDVKNKKVGVQLYTVRDLIAKDAKGTIKQVAALGYSEVENFGYNGKYFGMTAAGTAVFTTKLERLNGKPVYHVVGTGVTHPSYDWRIS